MNRLALLLVLLSFLLEGCGKVSPPERPAGVPAKAVWAGGVDGGAFIVCEVDLARDVNHCKTWNDHTGDVWESGEYRLGNTNRAARASELVYMWADGLGRIGLDNDLILKKLSDDHAR